MLRTPWTIALLTTIFVASRAPASHATVVLDQEYIRPPIDQGADFSNPTTSFRRVQTFTVGVAGRLHHVEGYFNGTGPTAGPEARIVKTSGGYPTEIILASTTSLTPLDDHWQRYDFTASALDVRVGDVLGIEFMEGSPSKIWIGNAVGGYVGGGSYFQNPAIYPAWLGGDSDQWFRTYVEEFPVPAQESTWGRIKQSYR